MAFGAPRKSSGVGVKPQARREEKRIPLTLPAISVAGFNFRRDHHADGPSTYDPSIVTIKRTVFLHQQQGWIVRLVV